MGTGLGDDKGDSIAQSPLGSRRISHFHRVTLTKVAHNPILEA
jgi:hypothetical protein